MESGKWKVKVSALPTISIFTGRCYLPLRSITRVPYTLVIPSQCAHWRGNPFSCGAKHRAAFGGRGYGLPLIVNALAMTGKPPLRSITRVPYTLVIPSQCAHWRGNPFSCGATRRVTIPQSRCSRDSSLYTREPLGYGLPRTLRLRSGCSQ